MPPISVWDRGPLNHLWVYQCPQLLKAMDHAEKQTNKNHLIKQGDVPYKTQLDVILKSLL